MSADDAIFQQLVGERLFTPESVNEQRDQGPTTAALPPRHLLADEPEYPRLRPRNDTDATGAPLR